MLKHQMIRKAKFFFSMRCNLYASIIMLKNKLFFGGNKWFWRILLTDAGFDPQALKAVKAVAVDGFTVNYGPELFLLDDTLLGYGSTDGPLTAEDGTFRMVLPEQEGKLNIRMLVKVQVVQ